MKQYKIEVGQSLSAFHSHVRVTDTHLGSVIINAHVPEWKAIALRDLVDLANIGGLANVKDVLAKASPEQADEIRKSLELREDAVCEAMVPKPKASSVKSCSWCPNPDSPDPECHPNGQAEHLPKSKLPESVISGYASWHREPRPPENIESRSLTDLLESPGLFGPGILEAQSAAVQKAMTAPRDERGQYQPPLGDDLKVDFHQTKAAIEAILRGDKNLIERASSGESLSDSEKDALTKFFKNPTVKSTKVEEPLIREVASVIDGDATNECKPNEGSWRDRPPML